MWFLDFGNVKSDEEKWHVSQLPKTPIAGPKLPLILQPEMY